MRAIMVLVALLLSSFSSTAEELAGRIWDVASGDFISTPELIQKLSGVDYVFIGERHGRAAHQNRSAFIIGALAERGSTPNIVFEMLTHEQTEIVAQYRRRAPEYALALATDLDWSNSGWPAWSYYYPIFNMAFTTKADIWGGDLTEAEQDAAMDINRPVDAKLLYYAEQMRDAHCGLIDETRVAQLSRLQVARDVSMANALEMAGPSNGAILIAGSSHIRKNIGVPSLLTGTKSIVLLRETNGYVSEFLERSELAVSQPLNSYDYIWFTPKIDESSLCDRLQ